ncbi:MAG: D-aminoacyl-tRNA deacylase [Candidatus Zixiibacteriota bacterium]
MRLLIQRVEKAEVWIDGKIHSTSGRGLLIFFSTKNGDKEESCNFLADKAVNLRIFEDPAGKMNLSALDVNAEIMVVSQFTLYADTKKGRRPAFTEAMEPVQAERLYGRFTELIEASGLKTCTGEFGSKMDVKLTNHGPVTILLEHDI